MSALALLCALAVTLACAGPALAQGQSVWRLQPIQLTDPYQGQERALRIDGMQYDARGGTVSITALNDGECQPGKGVPESNIFQRFRFQWTFDRDVSVLGPSQPAVVTFRIDGDSQPCMDQNPMFHFYGGGDPVVAIPREHDGARFYFKAHGFHVGGPRTFQFWPGTARQAGLFTINIWGFSGRRGMQLVFTYPYQLVATAPPPVTADRWTQDLMRRASRDRRFGAAVPGSLGAQPQWAPAWELRWMDFAFTNGRQVRVYHAMSRTDPSQRYTIYWDPDTGQWTGWEAGG